MQIFLKKLVTFFIPIVLAVICFEVGLRFLPNTYDIKRSLLDKNLGNIEVVFLGTSHTFSGIDPQKFNNIGVNLANNSQSIYYDLKILDNYIGRLPKLETVFFEINFFTFEYNLDKGPEAFRNKFYYQSFDIQPQTDNLGIFNKVRIANLTSSEILLLAQNQSINKIYETNVGFAKNDLGFKVMADSLIERKFNLFDSGYINSDSDEILPLFKTICKKLNEKNVNIVFVQLPVRNKLCQLIKASNKSEHLLIAKVLIEENDAVLLDYLCDNRFNDSLFVDSDHLTSQGAEIFSNILKEDFENSLK